jgi:hypothetical protein
LRSFASAVSPARRASFQTLPADLVQRVGRELDHVERVHAADRVGASLRDRYRDRLGHVAGHELELFAAFFAEQIEELLDRLAVAAGGGPHQPAAVVVDDHGQVPMALAMREVIHADAREAGEQVTLRGLLAGDPRADRADRPPGHAHQLRDRFLGRVDRQPAQLIFKGDREA